MGGDLPLELSADQRAGTETPGCVTERPLLRGRQQHYAGYRAGRSHGYGPTAGRYVLGAELRERHLPL
jgi:hypothetical protein